MTTKPFTFVFNSIANSTEDAKLNSKNNSRVYSLQILVDRMEKGQGKPKC